MNNNKRKVDVNDNLEGFAFALPRVPPPALRSTNAFGRRQSIAGGTLPGRSGTSAPVFAVPAAPTAAPTAPAVAVGSSSSASRRHAEEQEQLDSVYNGYITTLSWKRKLEMSAASSRQDIDDQLSILLQDSARINEHKAKECGKLHALGLLQSSCDVACSLPFLLDESVMRELVPLDAVSECVNSRMNSLRCKEVKPIVDIQEFDNVAESLYEFGEIFCIPPEARKIAVNTAGCLHDVGESRIIAEEENKSLDKLKDTNYCLLAQNFSSTMKLS